MRLWVYACFFGNVCPGLVSMSDAIGFILDKNELDVEAAGRHYGILR
jgi:hypothetical protein